MRTAAVGICATDLKMIAGWERTAFPAVPGHEWAGRVDAVGDGVSAHLIGCPCVGENVLADGGEVGFEHPGAYAEAFVTDAPNLHALPESFPLHVAAAIEPLAVCVHAMHRLGMEEPESALIIGDGPVGLMLLMLLRHMAAPAVVIVGGRESRLRLARALGAEATVNYHDCAGDLAAGIREQRGGRFANVLEASGSAAGAEAGVALAAAGGRVLVMGDYGALTAQFHWNDLLLRELHIIGSNASAGAWAEAVRLAVEDAVPLDRLITHELPATRCEEAMALVRSRESGAVKVLLCWDRET